MKIFLFLLFSILYLYPQPASAHAFGTQYTLPIPFTLYFYGAAAALLVSFVIIGFFMKQTKKDLSYPVKLLFHVAPDALWLRVMRITVQCLAFCLFLLTILTGFLGINDFAFNFNMTFFWIIFLLGITYASALFGNIYVVLNPFNTLIEGIAFVWNMQIKGILPYPQRFGYWPAFGCYVLLIWFELVGETTPWKLSLLLLVYTSITIIGVFLFGKKKWFEKAEFFSVFFRLIGYMAPLEYSNGNLLVRPPFAGLLTKTTNSFSLLFFILFMLASTAFDGFRETVAWGSVASTILPLLQPFFQDQAGQVLDTLFLLLSPFLFLGIYVLVIAVTKLLVTISVSTKSLLLRYAFSLLPIALVYNISHYYTLFVIQGQDIIRLISDPFGYNWNLFGTNTFSPDLTLIPTTTIWQTEVVFLLGGHIVAVYLSHLLSLKIYKTHKEAVISQFPMLFLMVFYTVLGLWILSQPLSVGK